MGNGMEKPETAKYTDKCEGNGMACGVSSMQGWRGEMEDAHLCVSSIAGRPECSVYGVFDGHGGSKIAMLCASDFVPVLCGTQGFSTAESAEQWSQVLYRAFLTLDSRMRRKVGGEDEERSGATAVVALVTPSDILVANAGDSRCVLCRSGKAVEMSEDHKPTNPAERRRITRAGGMVALGRVNGELAVSRAMGDYSFKTRRELGADAQMVTAAPDVRSMPRHSKDDLLVLACDGIWDVISSEEAVKLVRADVLAPSTGPPRPNMTNVRALDAVDTAGMLVDHCLDAGSRDNMTACVVVFASSATKVRQPNIPGAALPGASPSKDKSGIGAASLSASNGGIGARSASPFHSNNSGRAASGDSSDSGIPSRARSGVGSRHMQSRYGSSGLEEESLGSGIGLRLASGPSPVPSSTPSSRAVVSRQSSRDGRRTSQSPSDATAAPTGGNGPVSLPSGSTSGLADDTAAAASGRVLVPSARQSSRAGGGRSSRRLVGDRRARGAIVRVGSRRRMAAAAAGGGSSSSRSGSARESLEPIRVAASSPGDEQSVGGNGERSVSLPGPSPLNVDSPAKPHADGSKHRPPSHAGRATTAARERTTTIDVTAQASPAVAGRNIRRRSPKQHDDGPDSMRASPVQMTEPTVIAQAPESSVQQSRKNSSDALLAPRPAGRAGDFRLGSGVDDSTFGRKLTESDSPYDRTAIDRAVSGSMHTHGEEDEDEYIETSTSHQQVAAHSGHQQQQGASAASPSAASTTNAGTLPKGPAARHRVSPIEEPHREALLRSALPAEQIDVSLAEPGPSLGAVTSQSQRRHATRHEDDDDAHDHAGGDHGYRIDQGTGTAAAADDHDDASIGGTAEFVTRAMSQNGGRDTRVSPIGQSHRQLNQQLVAGADSALGSAESGLGGWAVHGNRRRGAQRTRKGSTGAQAQDQAAVGTGPSVSTLDSLSIVPPMGSPALAKIGPLRINPSADTGSHGHGSAIRGSAGRRGSRGSGPVSLSSMPESRSHRSGHGSAGMSSAGALLHGQEALFQRLPLPHGARSSTPSDGGGFAVVASPGDQELIDTSVVQSAPRRYRGRSRTDGSANEVLYRQMPGTRAAMQSLADAKRGSAAGDGVAERKGGAGSESVGPSRLGMTSYFRATGDSDADMAGITEHGARQRISSDPFDSDDVAHLRDSQRRLWENEGGVGVPEDQHSHVQHSHVASGTSGSRPSRVRSAKASLTRGRAVSSNHLSAGTSTIASSRPHQHDQQHTTRASTDTDTTAGGARSGARARGGEFAARRGAGVESHGRHDEGIGNVGAAAAGRTNPRRVGRALSNPTEERSDRVLYRDSALAHDISAPSLPGSATEARTRRGISRTAVSSSSTTATTTKQATKNRAVSMGRGPGGSTSVMTGGVAREHMLSQAGVKTSSAGRATHRGRDPVNTLPMPVATATKGSASATASFIARSSAAEAISAARRVYTDRMGQRNQRAASGTVASSEAAIERRSGALPGAPSGPASRQSRARDAPRSNGLFWGKQNERSLPTAATSGGGGGSIGSGGTVVSAARRAVSVNASGKESVSAGNANRSIEGGRGTAGRGGRGGGDSRDGTGAFERASGIASAMENGASTHTASAVERALAQRGAISFQGPSRSRRGADGSILAPVEAPGRISGHGVRRIGSNRSITSGTGADFAPHQPRAQASGPSVRWGGAGKGSSGVLPGPRYDPGSAVEPGMGRRGGPKTRYT